VPREQLPFNTLSYLWRELAGFKRDDWAVPLAVVVDGRHRRASTDGEGLPDHPPGRIRVMARAEAPRPTATAPRCEQPHCISRLPSWALRSLPRRRSSTIRPRSRLPPARLQDDGVDRMAREGVMVEQLRFRLTRDDWQRHRAVDVRVDGFERCRRSLASTTDTPRRTHCPRDRPAPPNELADVVPFDLAGAAAVSRDTSPSTSSATKSRCARFFPVWIGHPLESQLRAFGPRQRMNSPGMSSFVVPSELLGPPAGQFRRIAAVDRHHV